MGAIELQRKLSGNRYLTSLKGERREGIIWPDQVIGPVEKIGGICFSLRFEQHELDPDLLVEERAFMRKALGLNGDEFITGRTEPSIQLLKVPGRIQEVNLTMEPWWGELPEFFGSPAKKPGHHVCLGDPFHDGTYKLECVDAHGTSPLRSSFLIKCISPFDLLANSLIEHFRRNAYIIRESR